MIYLSVPPARDDWPRFAEAGIGIIRTPVAGVALECVQHFPYWAADNGCYSQGERFDLDAFLDWLEVMAPASLRCLFAVAPDVVGDARATWERSHHVLTVIRALGYKSALVAQDGWDSAAVDWARFDALFIGGTDEFKFSDTAWNLIAEARARHKWVHVGRVNSWSRCRWAAASGVQSADGSTVAFNTGRYVPEVIRWAHRLRMSPLWHVRELESQP